MTRPLLALLLAGLALAGAAAEPGAHAVAVHAPLTTHADAAVPALLPARRSAVSTTARAATDGAHSPAGRRLAGGGESGGGAAAESRGEARLGPFEGWPSLALLIALCACACCVLPLVVLFYTHRLRALQRGLGAQPSSAVPLVMITDTGQDLDDEMALIMCRFLVDQGLVDLRAVVANLQPALARARLVRGTLDLLRLRDVPVGAGTDGGSRAQGDTFSDTAAQYMPTAQAARTLSIEPGLALLKRVLSAAAPASVTLLLISSLRDAAILLRDYPALVREKVARVVIMGGVELPPALRDASEPGAQDAAAAAPSLRASRVARPPATSAGWACSGCARPSAAAARWSHSSDSVRTALHAWTGAGRGAQPSAADGDDGADDFLRPDSAHNNMFDMRSARFVYSALQEMGVPMTVVSRHAAYAAPVRRDIYDHLAQSGSPIGWRLRKVQRESIEQLWRRACAPPGSAEREGLPERCTKEWFSQTFCAGEAGGRAREDAIWDLVQSFNMYDVISLLACVPALADALLAPTELQVRGTRHALVGLSAAVPGVQDAKAMSVFVARGLAMGVGATTEAAARTPLLVFVVDEPNVPAALMLSLLAALASSNVVTCAGLVVVERAAAGMASDLRAAELCAELGLSGVCPVLTLSEADASRGAVERICALYDGLDALDLVLCGAAPRVLAALARRRPRLFREKTASVTCRGTLGVVAERRMRGGGPHSASDASSTSHGGGHARSSTSAGGTVSDLEGDAIYSDLSPSGAGRLGPQGLRRGRQGTGHVGHSRHATGVMPLAGGGGGGAAGGGGGGIRRGRGMTSALAQRAPRLLPSATSPGSVGRSSGRVSGASTDPEQEHGGSGRCSAASHSSSAAQRPSLMDARAVARQLEALRARGGGHGACAGGGAEEDPGPSVSAAVSVAASADSSPNPTPPGRSRHHEAGAGPSLSTVAELTTLQEFSGDEDEEEVEGEAAQRQRQQRAEADEAAREEGAEPQQQQHGGGGGGRAADVSVDSAGVEIIARCVDLGVPLRLVPPPLVDACAVPRQLLDEVWRAAGGSRRALGGRVRARAKYASLAAAQRLVGAAGAEGAKRLERTHGVPAALTLDVVSGRAVPPPPGAAADAERAALEAREDALWQAVRTVPAPLVAPLAAATARLHARYFCVAAVSRHRGTRHEELGWAPQHPEARAEAEAEAEAEGGGEAAAASGLRALVSTALVGVLFQAGVDVELGAPTAGGVRALHIDGMGEVGLSGELPHWLIGGGEAEAAGGGAGGARAARGPAAWLRDARARLRGAAGADGRASARRRGSGAAASAAAVAPATATLTAASHAAALGSDEAPSSLVQARHEPDDRAPPRDGAPAAADAEGDVEAGGIKRARDAQRDAQRGAGRAGGAAAGGAEEASEVELFAQVMQRVEERTQAPVPPSPARRGPRGSRRSVGSDGGRSPANLRRSPAP